MLFFDINPVNKITEKIYLGNIDGARNTQFFKKEKITHIISLAGKMFTPIYDKNIIQFQKIIDIEDDWKENIIKYFKECFEIIEKANKIFIHCMAGVSRSATIVISYLMWKEKKSLEETLKKVKEKRFVSPNFGFMEQLKIFEKLLKENNYDLNKIDLNSVKWPNW